MKLEGMAIFMLGTLFKLNLKALFSATFARATRSKTAGMGRKILFGFLFLYIGCALMVAFGAMFTVIIKPFFEVGIGWLYFALYAVIAFGLCVLTTMFTATSQIFEAKDNESLLSLPIKASTILVSRIFVLLVYEYIFSILIALPAIAVWTYFGYATALGIIFFVISFFLLPLFSLAFALLLAWVLSLLTARMRHKNIFVLILSLAFMIGYFQFYFNIQKYLGALVSKGQELAASFQKAVPPFYYFGSALTTSNALHFFYFVLWMLIPFAICIWLLSINYNKLLTSTRNTANVKYVAKELKKSSQVGAMIRKELAYFWSKPSIILNTSLGSILAVVGSIYLLVKKGMIMGQITPYLSLLGSGITITLIFAVAITLIASMNDLSASLISLEGKYIWIAKSIPVPTKDILKSKILTHIILTSVPCLIASILLSFFAGDISSWLLLFILPQAFVFLMANMGLLLNLLAPKLDWITEMAVVKQGMSALISMFGAMGVVIGLGVLYYFALPWMSLMVYLWLAALLFAVGGCLGYWWIGTKGVKRFNEI